MLFVALFMAGFVGRVSGSRGRGAWVDTVDAVKVELCEADGEVDKSFYLYVIRCGVFGMCVWFG